MRTHALFVCAIIRGGVSSVAHAQIAEPAPRGIVVDARTRIACGRDIANERRRGLERGANS
jgi:hypothetical protein